MSTSKKTDKIPVSNLRLRKLEEFQKQYKLNFKNINLLNQAFIHKSYTNENELSSFCSYEKLEFYGDAVLKLVTSDFLYNNFKDYEEGELTKLRGEIVSDKNISRYAAALGLEKLILLGTSEAKQGGAKKSSILACAFEALLGAIFIEYKASGYKKVKEFLKDNFGEDILSINQQMNQINPKSTLQEYTQAINHSLPIYKLIKEEGPAHNKKFFVEVAFQGKILAQGKGKSIKEAEQLAAQAAVEKLKLENKELNND